MEIAVIVPDTVHWEAFMTDLRELWQPTNYRRYQFVEIGEIRYKMVNLGDSYSKDKLRGRLLDKVYIYNCRMTRDLKELLDYLICFGRVPEFVNIEN